MSNSINNSRQNIIEMLTYYIFLFQEMLIANIFSWWLGCPCLLNHFLEYVTYNNLCSENHLTCSKSLLFIDTYCTIAPFFMPKNFDMQCFPVLQKCYSSVIVLFCKPCMQHLFRNVNNQHIFETLTCNISQVSENVKCQHFFLVIGLDYL